jgi:class 3 adenylate cyclase
LSLRYKALIVVVLLFAALTGALVYSSSDRFETRARVRINDELDREVKTLETQIEARSEVMHSTLKASAVGSELVEMVRDEDWGDINDALSPFAEEWLKDSGADIALACLGRYVTEDRNPNILGPAGKDASIVALEGREKLSPDSRKELLGDPVLNRFMSEYFEADFNAGENYVLEPYREAVLPVAGRVYLAVQVYLWVSVQDEEVAGVGTVLKELSSDWLQQFYAAEAANPVQTVVFNDAGPVASTGSQEIAAEGLKAAEGDNFELNAEGDMWIGRMFRSSLTPDDSENIVGFLALKNLDVELAGFREARRDVLLVAILLAVIGALLAYVGAYRVIRVLRNIQEATHRVREGKFDTRVEVNRRDELGDLGKAFNDMTGGLKALGLYTPETLARNVLDNPQLLGTASSRETGTIFFSDIKGFTGITESMSAEDLTEQLNEYFAALGVLLREERGYVDKFIGDSIMAFWGKPFVKEGDFARRAVRAARGCLDVLKTLQTDWEAAGKPVFHQRIGLATGEVIVGNIGTKTKKNFTVIGDSVNLASRLEGINKLYGTTLIIDETTAEAVKDEFLLREIDRARVVGKSEPVSLFEPIFVLSEASHDQKTRCDAYALALEYYRKGERQKAILAAKKVLEQWPDDGPAAWLLAHCEGIEGDYEAVTNAESK